MTRRIPSSLFQTGIFRSRVNSLADMQAKAIAYVEEPPREIIEAAEKVGRWFAERNITQWELGPVMSRNGGN